MKATCLKKINKRDRWRKKKRMPERRNKIREETVKKSKFEI
jgi:hypothetical protein